MASDVLRSMEVAAKANAALAQPSVDIGRLWRRWNAGRNGETSYNRYGTSDKKQVYVYGSLEKGPIILDRNYGTAWGVSGWLVINYLASAPPERVEQHRKRIAAELKTTFRTEFSQTLSLREALLPANIRKYTKQKTGQKFLIDPSV